LEENLELALIVARDFGRGKGTERQSAVGSCHLSILFKVLLFRVKKPRRIRKLTLERERTFIFRSRGASRLGWCEECQAEVELMSVAVAAQHTKFSELALYQLIETGGLHFEREGDVNILVCLNSLRHNQRSLEEGRNEQTQTGDDQQH